MKRLSSRDEFIFHHPLLLVGEQGPVFLNDLFAQLDEARFDGVRRGVAVEVMDGEFKQPTTEKPSFDSAGFGVRDEAFARLDFDDAQASLIAGQGDGDIHCMAGRPVDELFWGVAPVQAKGWAEQGLRAGMAADEEKAESRDPEQGSEGASVHAGSVGGCRAKRKKGSMRRGMILVEAMMSLAILTVIGLTLLKLSLNILYPRQWVLNQTVTEAYLSYERAYAERIPFDTLVSSNSPWPAYPMTTTTTAEIGRLPGGKPIIGTVVRTRIPDAANYPIDGGSGTLANNPAAMKVWKVQSVLTYKVGDRDYAKSRTVLRSQ